MACLLFDAKPLSKPILAHCQLNHFHLRKYIWKYRRQKRDHFSQPQCFKFHYFMQSISGGPLTLTYINFKFQYGKAITCPVKCGMKLFIHSQTSTVQPLKVKEWISNFTPHCSLALSHRCIFTRFGLWAQNTLVKQVQGNVIQNGWQNLARSSTSWVNNVPWLINNLAIRAIKSIKQNQMLHKTPQEINDTAKPV